MAICCQISVTKFILVLVTISLSPPPYSCNHSISSPLIATLHITFSASVSPPPDDLVKNVPVTVSGLIQNSAVIFPVVGIPEIEVLLAY